MSVSTLNFSATLPPFYYTSGYNTNFSGTNSSLSGNLLLSSATDSNGFTSTNVSSSVNSNGLSYAETGAALIGNQLTVNYQTDNVTSGTLVNSNINGSGIGFTPESGTLNGNSLNTTYGIAPNGALNQTIQGAATSTGIGSDNIQLESIAEVGNTLTVTYQIGGQPVNTTTQAPAAGPQTPAPATPVPASNGPAASFSSQGLMTIGDVLANSSGLTANGAFGNALQANAGVSTTSTATPDEAAILAATLNPGINLSPNNSLQITDFVDTSASAFPTSGPAAPADNTNNTSNNGANNDNPFDNNTSDTNNTIGGQNNTSGADDTSNTANTGTFSQSTGIYSAVANASSSNILGSNYSSVA